MTNIELLDFQQFRYNVIKQLQQDIEAVFSSVVLSDSLKQACHYAMTGDGKKVRPLLVASSYASGHTLRRHTSVSPQSSENLFPLPIFVRRAMLAVEFIHVYSLVHDDLPCMDDDDLRRGRATCHVAFGEARALLVGDVLQTLAFEILTTDLLSETDVKNEDEDTNCNPSVSAYLSAQLVSILAPRARRMVSGQMLDLEGEQQNLTYPQLKAIHKDKTGALIEASVLMGAICAKATENQLALLSDFAQKIGLAFQVQDDILDVVSDTQQLGKPSGSDEKLDKSTYVKLMGIEEAKIYANDLFQQGKQDLIQLRQASLSSELVFSETQEDTQVRESQLQCHNYLADLADWLWERKK